MEESRDSKQVPLIKNHDTEDQWLLRSRDYLVEEITLNFNYYTNDGDDASWQNYIVLR